MIENMLNHINWAMSLREPQREALNNFNEICNRVDFVNNSKNNVEYLLNDIEAINTFSKFDKSIDFPSFCFEMATGIGKTRLMGAIIYYLYKTKGYKHFFILAPGNTIYDKLRKESLPHHPKYIFKGLEAEMGRPKVYDGENYLTYPVKYAQQEHFGDKESEIQIFIFNIGKIFKRGDMQFKFHDFQEQLGGSFSDVLKSFDDLVICMDEAHRYYAPASLAAINHLDPILGLEFTATPKKSNKNIIYRYDLAKGAGHFLKIPVVMGRTNTAGYSDDDIEQMKILDGLKLHERRKKVVYNYCTDNNIPQVKPIVLIACKDTTHASKVREMIDSEEILEGKYRGKVIEIHSKKSGSETEENIRKLLTIEQNTNPIEIVIHVYKLKEGWDVNNLFTIIPLNAAKSEILALQTIGRGLRLPFGQVTGREELDTLDIVAHDHYREIIDDVKDNPLFRSRNLDEEDIEETESVEVYPEFTGQQFQLFEEAVEYSTMKTYQDIDDINIQEELYKGYLKSYAKKVVHTEDNGNSQLSLFDIGKEIEEKPEVFVESINKGFDQDKNGKQDKVLNKNEFIEKLKTFSSKAIGVPKISMSYSSKVFFKPFEAKIGVSNFELEKASIERYDLVNDKLLDSMEAVALEVDDPENELACMLLEAIDEFSADDADYILDVVNQYLSLMDSEPTELRKIIRRYAYMIVEDMKKQIYESMEEETEFVYKVDKELIVFGKFVKNYKAQNIVDKKKTIPDKKNIKKYLYTGYEKSYYTEYGFDSDDERKLALILEEDVYVKKWLKPPLNQLGLFYLAAKQYTPDFIVELADYKYMIEVKGRDRISNDDVLAKAKEAMKWCQCATEVDPDGKKWIYRLIPGDQIVVGNTFKYIVSTSEDLEGLIDE